MKAKIVMLLDDGDPADASAKVLDGDDNPVALTAENNAIVIELPRDSYATVAHGDYTD